MVKLIRRFLVPVAALCTCAAIIGLFSRWAAAAVALLGCAGIAWCARRHGTSAQDATKGALAELGPRTAHPVAAQVADRSLTHERERKPRSIQLFLIASPETTSTPSAPDAARLEVRADKADWHEYGPIREFLLNHPLEEGAYYGFFPEEMGGAALEARERITQHTSGDGEEYDVFLFDPDPESSALFLNIFEELDYNEPGFLSLCEELFRYMGIRLDLQYLPMDIRQASHENLFFAKPHFWRAWLDLNEKLFAICEGPHSPLKELLTGCFAHVPRKVQVMKSMTSMLLVSRSDWRSCSFGTPTQTSNFPSETVVCQALKLALREQDRPEYWDLYAKTRDAVFESETWKRLRAERSAEGQFGQISLANEVSRINKGAPTHIDTTLSAPRIHARPMHLFHIAYSKETLAHAPAGAQVLENFTHRADWREYWPIRNFLLHEPLQENSYYGFFSPKLKEKTQLNYTDIHHFITNSEEEADVYLFSPYPEYSAFYLNTFAQLENDVPGTIATSAEFLKHAGINVELPALVMDARHTIYSNYFVAKPRFWRAWLSLNEKLFEICEGPDTPLKARLLAKTNYAGDVQQKVFIMERTASLLLALDDGWRTWSLNSFRLLTRAPEQAVLCQALKFALREQARPQFADMYEQTRRTAFMNWHAPTNDSQ